MVYLVKSFRVSLNPDADFRTVRKPELGIRGESGGGVFSMKRKTSICAQAKRHENRSRDLVVDRYTIRHPIPYRGRNVATGL